MSGIRPGSFFSRGSHSVSPTGSTHSSTIRSSSSRNSTPEQTPPGRRGENITMSSGELNSLFDGINAMNSQIKRQGKVLESLAKRQDEMLEELHALAEDNKSLMENIAAMEKQNEEGDGKIPPEICVSSFFLR